jgi:hypothetical protein
MANMTNPRNIFVRTLKGKDHLAVIDINGKITLKLILNGYKDKDPLIYSFHLTKHKVAEAGVNMRSLPL